MYLGGSVKVLGICENPEDKSENRTHFEAGIWVSSSKESTIYEVNTYHCGRLVTRLSISINLLISPCGVAAKV